ncbi:hypothetical protein YC2023_078483 [Brassica napus]
MMTANMRDFELSHEMWGNMSYHIYSLVRGHMNFGKKKDAVLSSDSNRHTTVTLWGVFELRKEIPKSQLCKNSLSISGIDRFEITRSNGSIDPDHYAEQNKCGAYTDRHGPFHSISKGRFHTDRPISNYRPIDPWKHRYESW